MFHAILLRPYEENKIYGKNFPTPPPDLVEGEESYEVETILNHRKQGRGYQYLIKWAGYPITEALWESEQSFNSDGDTLTSYKQRHQLWVIFYLSEISTESIHL